MTDLATTVPASFSIPPSPMRRIAEEVAHKHGLTLEQLKSRTQDHKIAHARQEAMWRMYEEAGKSNLKIALFFHMANHTTVIHARRAHERRLQG